MRRFSRILPGVLQGFSAVQIAWRCAQSGANRSPSNSLLTGKNTGNLRNFAPKIEGNDSKSHILLEKAVRGAEIEQGIIMNVSGN